MLVHQRPVRTAPLPDAEVLIPEARQRQRRRRATVGGGVLVAAVAVAAALVAGGSGGSVRPKPVARRAASGPAVADVAAFHGEGDLAFVSEGHLYVLDGTTDRLTAVTSGSEQASSPAFSSDGRWLTYTLDNGYQVLLARANGSEPRVIATNGSVRWLRGDELVIGTRLWRVEASGKLRLGGPAPDGLDSWSTSGHEYVFVTTTLVSRTGTTSIYHERIELAPTLGGRRTVWWQTPITVITKPSYTEALGEFAGEVTVLPGDEGILFTIDPNHDDDADGAPVYEVRSPGAPMVKLGTMLPNPDTGAVVTFGPAGAFAFGGGGSRWIWDGKAVRVCDAAHERCTPVPAPAGEVTLYPAWSPSGSTLAYVAARGMGEVAIPQSTVAAWYATHHLYLLERGSTRPVEVAGADGASWPTWSADGKSLLYVAGDGLWLVRAPGAKPVEIAAPLYVPNAWPISYGQEAWSTQFAWSSAASAEDPWLT